MLLELSKGGTAILRDGMKVTGVAEKFGVHRDTTYVWLARYEAEGLEGLADRSHRPRGLAHADGARDGGECARASTTASAFGPMSIRHNSVEKVRAHLNWPHPKRRSSGSTTTSVGASNLGGWRGHRWICSKRSERRTTARSSASEHWRVGSVSIDERCAKHWRRRCRRRGSPWRVVRRRSSQWKQPSMPGWHPTKALRGNNVTPRRVYQRLVEEPHPARCPLWTARPAPRRRAWLCPTRGQRR